MCPATPETGVRAARSASPDRTSLAVRLVTRLALTLVCAAALLYIPAGTWHYWEASLFIAVAFLPVALIQIGFLIQDPAILERRLESRESLGVQRRLIAWFKPLFVLVLLIPGLDHRFSWSRTLLHAVPLRLIIGCDALLVAGLVFAGWVIHVNAFAGCTIRVEASQPLISTGPYCLIRHPLYAASILLVLAMPLALGSWIALPAFACLIPFYVLRLLNEEELLRAKLPGYSAYCQRTPFRLVPFIW